MRDRLIELMAEICEINSIDNGEFIETDVNWNDIADHLLADGWIRLPCNIGDTVYSIGKEYTKCHLATYYGEIMCDGCEAECDSHCKRFVVTETVTSLQYDGTNWRVFTNLSPMFAKTIGLYKYGTGVFLTKEEAEKALEEGGQND